MGNRKTKVPSIPDPRPENVQIVLQAMKEAIEVGEARRGDPLDAKVTFRDLIDANLATLGGFGMGGAGTGTGGPGDRGTPGPGSPFLKPPTYDGLVLPGRPTNVHTMAVWDGIQVIWDWPDAAGTRTYWKRAVIWASATPSFEYATIVGYSTTNFFTHMGIGLSAPEIPGVTTQPGVRYYWVAWEGNWNEAKGAPDRTDSTPYPHQPGVRGQTALNPEYVLTLLEGQITESQIYASLNERINLVDYNPDNPGEPFTTPVQTRILLAGEQFSDSVYAAIAETASVKQHGGTLFGEYNLRLDLNGYVVGFGLSALADIDGVGTAGATSTFVVKVDRFAVAYPKPGSDDIAIPFIVGQVGGVSTVGINGQLVVDGTVTANSIQAGSIGTAQLNAQQVYADMMTADHIISGSFATSVDPNFRLEINGDGGQNELFPLWYGNGTTGGDGSVFFLDRFGTVKLAGELYVTGAGKFFAGNWETDQFGNPVSGEYRVEIGGPLDDFLLWAGTGVKSLSNEDGYVFYIDNEGNAKFKGTVEAKFVSGEISRTFVIHQFNAITLPIYHGTDIMTIPNWTVIGTWQLPAPPFEYGHVPTIHINFSLFGDGQEAGATRLMFRELLPGGTWTGWSEIVRTAWDITNYGEMKTMIGAAARVYGVCEFQLEGSGFDGSGPSSNHQIGIVMGIR